MATHPARRKARFPRRGITRLRSCAYDPDRAGREFGERMRAAFDRLRADPVAWQDYVDEFASMNPLSDPASFR
jgi:hypothetical protein